MIGCAAGLNAGVALGGHSAVVGPGGDIVVEDCIEPGVLLATIDLTLPSAARREFSALDDRILSVDMTTLSEVSSACADFEARSRAWDTSTQE